jgi:hypothetical protein
VRDTSRGALGLLAAAVLITGCASRQTGTTHTGTPPKLHIAGYQAAGADSAAKAPMAAALNGTPLGVRSIFGDTYVLAGSLPDKPTHASVWRWTDAPASASDVVNVGKAVGVTGTPQRHPHGWLLTSAAGEVRVSDAIGHQWSYARADQLTCSPYGIDIDNNPDGGATSSGCAVAVSPNEQIPNGPDDAATRAAAASVVSGLGLKGSAEVSVGAPTSVLMVSPLVGGLPTQGIETSIDVDAKGVRGVFGRLAEPTAGDDYPLVTAKAGFDQLSNRPRTMMAMPYCGPIGLEGKGIGTPQMGVTSAASGPSSSDLVLPSPAGPPVAQPSAVQPGVVQPSPPDLPPSAPSMTAAPSFGTAEPSSTPEPLGPPTIAPCPTPKPLRVTGATLGLVVSYDGNGVGSELLVPAWFFSIEGSSSPTAQIAVDPSFIEQPAPQPLDSGFTGGGSGVGGSAIPPTPPNGPASGVAAPTAGAGTGASASTGVAPPAQMPPVGKPVG